MYCFFCVFRSTGAQTLWTYVIRLFLCMCWVPLRKIGYLGKGQWSLFQSLCLLHLQCCYKILTLCAAVFFPFHKNSNHTHISSFSFIHSYFPAPRLFLCFCIFTDFNHLLVQYIHIVHYKKKPDLCSFAHVNILFIQFWLNLYLLAYIILKNRMWYCIWYSYNDSFFFPFLYSILYSFLYDIISYGNFSFSLSMWSIIMRFTNILSKKSSSIWTTLFFFVVC